MSTAPAVVVTVPGLRGQVEDHWQSRLAATRPNVVSVAPIGRENPDLVERIDALQAVVQAVDGPVVIVAHSAGVLITVHWAARHRGRIRGAVLATPPDLSTPLPPEYPSLAVLAERGWLPVPRQPLPFPSIVAASTNDPLSNPDRVRALADAWGSRHHVIGAVGHLNPASGYGDWPEAENLINRLDTAEATR